MQPIEGNTKLEVHPEKGVMSFIDEDTGAILAVYASPILLAGRKAVPLPLVWDETNNAISVSFASNTKFPVVLAFGISKVVPQAHERYKLFPIKVGPSGTPQDSPSDSESDKDEQDDDTKPEGSTKKVTFTNSIFVFPNLTRV